MHAEPFPAGPPRGCTGRYRTSLSSSDRSVTSRQDCPLPGPGRILHPLALGADLPDSTGSSHSDPGPRDRRHQPATSGLQEKAPGREGEEGVRTGQEQEFPGTRTDLDLEFPLDQGYGREGPGTETPSEQERGPRPEVELVPGRSPPDPPPGELLHPDSPVPPSPELGPALEEGSRLEGEPVPPAGVGPVLCPSEDFPDRKQVASLARGILPRGERSQVVGILGHLVPTGQRAETPGSHPGTLEERALLSEMSEESCGETQDENQQEQ